MSAVGLAAVYPAAHPGRAEIASLAPAVLRIFTYSFDELDAALAEVPGGVQVVVTINNQWAEVANGWQGWQQAARDFGPRFAGRVRYINLINEPDIWHRQPPVGKPDPTLTPEWCARMAALAAPHYHDAGIQVILPSVASGSWLPYLTRMAAEYKRQSNVPAWADLHGYVKRIDGHPPHEHWQEMGEAFAQALEAAQMPVCSTETGWKVGDAGGLDAHAEAVGRFVRFARGLNPADHPFLTLFCWSDRAGAPGEQWDHGFGLRDPDGNPRPAWHAFSEATGAPSQPAPEPRSEPTAPLLPPEAVPMPRPQAPYAYQLGIAEKVARMLAEGYDPGPPLEPETYPYPDSPYSYQMGERGLFVYSRQAKRVQFYESK